MILTSRSVRPNFETLPAQHEAEIMTTLRRLVLWNRTRYEFVDESVNMLRYVGPCHLWHGVSSVWGWRRLFPDVQGDANKECARNPDGFW